MSTEQGVVQNVLVRRIGDVLAVDAAIGATTLTLVDAADFNEDGGQLSVDGELLTYDSCDDETGIVTLSTVPTVAHTNGTEVFVEPASYEKTAVVSVSADEEPIEANVPYALWDRLPEGVRADVAEQVLLDEREDSFELVDVLGTEPVIEGSFVDTSTIGALPASAFASMPNIAPDVLTDGTYTGLMQIEGALTTRETDPVTHVQTGPGQNFSRESGFYSYGPVDAFGNEQPRLVAPTDPALPHVFRGEAFIDRLTVSDFIALSTSSLAEAAVMTMLTGIGAPTNAPTVSFEWSGVSLNIAGVNVNQQYAGLCLIGSTLWTAINDFDGAELGFLVESWNSTTGARLSVNAYALDLSEVHSITTDGTYLYVLTALRDAKGISTDSWTLVKIDPSDMSVPGAFAWGNAETGGGNTKNVALGYDASANELLIAQSRNDNGGKPRVHRYSPPTSSLTRNSFLDLDSSLGSTNGLAVVQYNTTDFAAARYVLAARASGSFRVYNTSGVRQTADEWPSAGNNAVAGVVFVAGAPGTWRSLDSAGIVYAYETDPDLRWTSSAFDTWRAAFSWYRSTGPNETPRSALATFAGKKRARLRITAYDPPMAGTAVPTHVRFFLHRGASAPAAGAMDYQGQVGAVDGISAQLVVTAPIFATGTHDVAANTFPGGVASKIQSTNGGYSVDGNGDGDVGVGTFSATKYRALVRRHASLSVADSTHVLVPWDFEDNDLQNMHAAGLFTIAVDGVYRITAQVTFTANNTGRRHIYLNRNSATATTNTIGKSSHPPHAAEDLACQFTWEDRLSSGDVLRMFVWQNSGAGLPLPADTSGVNRLHRCSILRVSP